MNTVLIVEDEPILRQILSRIISGGDRQVLTACDGAEALSILNRTHVDMVLSDIEMPNMTGLELLSSLRRLGNKVRFVFLSAYQDDEKKKIALDLGAKHFLTKPINKGALISVLMSVLERPL